MREPLESTPEQQAEDDRFFRWYGEWAPFDPAEVAAFMHGFRREIALDLALIAAEIREHQEQAAEQA